MTYFWNKKKNYFICLDKIRNFEIVVKSSSVPGNEHTSVTIVAWFSDVETLSLEEFRDKKEAETFLENLQTFSMPKEEIYA